MRMFWLAVRCEDGWAPYGRPFRSRQDGSAYYADRFPSQDSEGHTIDLHSFEVGERIETREGPGGTFRSSADAAVDDLRRLGCHVNERKITPITRHTHLGWNYAARKAFGRYRHAIEAGQVWRLSRG